MSTAGASVLSLTVNVSLSDEVVDQERKHFVCERPNVQKCHLVLQWLLLLHIMF